MIQSFFCFSGVKYIGKKVKVIITSLLMLQVIMTDPVIAADGHTYQRVAIETWLQSHNTSAITHEKLMHTRLVPNFTVRQILKKHAE